VNLALVAIISGEFEEMYDEAVAAATIAARHSEPVLELLAQGMLAWAAAMAGRLDQALRARERSAAAFRSLSDDQLGESFEAPYVLTIASLMLERYEDTIAKPSGS
jgi:hypothetical protein